MRKLITASVLFLAVAFAHGQGTSITNTASGLNSPYAVCYDSHNHSVYVTNFSNGTVSVIPDSGTTVSATITVGTSPGACTFDAHNNSIYVTNRGSNTVSVILDSGTVVSSTISSLNGPRGVAFDSNNNNIYITNYSGNTVSVVPDSGTTITGTVTGLTSPVGICFDSHNNSLYVANNGTTTVSVILDSGTTITGTVTGMTTPWRLAFDPHNNTIYVANAGSAVYTILDSGTSVTATITGFSGPQDVAFSPNTNSLYVSNTSNATVSIVLDSGTVRSGTITGFNGPVGVAYDSNTQSIWVGNFSTTTVSIVGTASARTQYPHSYLPQLLERGFAMRRLLYFLLVLASVPCWAGTTYYLNTAAGGGNDSNNGLSVGAPWLTPNHAVNCGDVILAAASTAYVDTNFSQNFGTVTCPSGNDVAWLKCAVFDTCKINSTSGFGTMWVANSYWGVQGWEVTASGTYATCFTIEPSQATPANIHHIIFANNIASGCGGGFGSNNRTASYGFDYVNYLGNIAYNAANSAATCNSGLNIYQPIASDTLPGTHIYVAGNFSYDNVNPNPCAGGAPTDGEGLILDTLDFSQGGGPHYTQQVAAENNILLFNGGPGLIIFNNYSGATRAKVYLDHNTTYGNEANPSQATTISCAEISAFKTYTTEIWANLTQTTRATNCGSNPVYNYVMRLGDGTDHVYGNYGYSATGSNTLINTSTGFSFGPSNTFTDPQFANPVNPGAPSCGAYSNTVACMATVIANFTPTNTAATNYGYQAVSSTAVYNPLFPQWLCSVTNLPSGLVTMGCAVASGINGGALGGAVIK